MTNEPSRNGKSQQSGFVKKEKMANSALLAAVSILGVSLGVTAAQSAVEVTPADGSSTHDFNTKLAETKTTLQSNHEKEISPKPVSKAGTHYEQFKRPDLFNPASPQAKPKR